MLLLLPVYKQEGTLSTHLYTNTHTLTYIFTCAADISLKHSQIRTFEEHFSINVKPYLAIEFWLRRPTSEFGAIEDVKTLDSCLS